MQTLIADAAGAPSAWTQTIIIALAGTVCTLATFLYRSQVGVFKTELDRLRERLDHLEKENDELSERVTELRVKEGSLRTQVTLWESSHQELPLPMWCKDADGRVITCNRAYEKLFLLPRGHTLEDYIHNTDSAVYPPHIAEEFARNDNLVFATGDTIDTVERVPNSDGEDRPVRIIKYLRKAGGVKLGVNGIAIPDKDFNPPKR